MSSRRRACKTDTPWLGGGVSWIYVSLSEFGGMPAPLALLATVLFCALLALFTGAAALLTAMAEDNQLAIVSRDGSAWTARRLSSAWCC